MLQIDAIEILKDIQGSLEETRIIERCAIDMAIEALKNIQALDKIPTNYLYDTETEHCLVYRHKYTGKEIHILKPTDLFVLERPHRQWIPCSERLPEEYHTYLVTKLDPNPSKSTFTTLAYFYTEETGWDIDDVIAWMPFPKPYRKEGDMDG